VFRPASSSVSSSFISIVAYLVVFTRARLYADSALQPIYVVRNIYGWWYWAHGGDGSLPFGVVEDGLDR
jgi:nicotinamide riboside transporter PnuC